MELFAKASLLWKQAHLIREAGSAIQLQEQVEQLLATLSRLRALDPPSAVSGTLLEACCIAHAALVCLFQPDSGSVSSSDESLEPLTSNSLAILEAVGTIDPGQDKYLNPIVTVGLFCLPRC